LRPDNPALASRLKKAHSLFYVLSIPPGTFRSSTMRSSLFKLVLALPLAVAAIPNLYAATAPASSASSAQTIIDAMTKANAAVVGVKVAAVKGARSAQTLGLNRSGSGVVIGSDGLILTI
jgi:S1-C subfamily serine protease